MSIDVDRYLGLRYEINQGPDKVRSREDALRGGINCVALAHLVLKDMFGELLPERLKCYEMYMDLEERFEDVDSAEIMRAGDLVWFGFAPLIDTKQFKPKYRDDGYLKNWSDFPVTHVGVFTGGVKEGDPMILHSTWFEEKNVVFWPLSEFRKWKKYAQVYAIRRLREAGARAQSECSAQQFATL